MRPIDADALKKYMDDCGWCDNCPDKKRLCDMDCRFPDFCTHEWQRVIDEQPTITASPWHRVDEGLPDKNKDAIFYYEWTGISGTVYRETSIISLNELIVLGCRPIEWMEIPERREPPKEEEHGN